MVIQYQIVSPENIHKSNIMHTEQVLFMYLRMYRYMYMICYLYVIIQLHDVKLYVHICKYIITLYKILKD